MGGRVEGEFFDALPEATDDSEDALRHGGCDVENGVEVVRHEAVLEQFDLGVSLGDLGEVVNDGSAEFGALHVGLHGFVVGDDEFTQQGVAGRYHKDHVVDADAAPSAAVLLPMPSVVCHVRQFGTKLHKKSEIRKFSGGILLMPNTISANGRNFLAREGMKGRRMISRQMDETYESVLDAQREAMMKPRSVE